MSQLYAMFTDPAMTLIGAISLGPQDAEVYPYQAFIDEADPRYIAWRAPFTPPAQDLATQERAWRDAELASLVWLRDRHRDQLEINFEATLTAEQFVELLTHMQDLRDWPQSPEFPDSQHRPTAPAWITEQIQ